MRKTLYLKLILAYIIFGLFGFVVVATFVSDMTINHLTKEKADALYREATLIANTYATDLYNTEVSLETVKTQLDALKNDILNKFETSCQPFKDAPEGEQEFLQLFSFIGLLSFDVYLKKLLIEKMVDELGNASREGERQNKK